MQQATILAEFWGKTGPPRDGEPDWHPCLCHCLDVAAMGSALLDINPRPIHATATALNCSTAQARALLLHLLFLHDIGKLGPPFQAKSEAHYPASLGTWRHEITDRHGHATLSHLALLRHFQTNGMTWAQDWRSSAFEALIAPFSGHHGRPVAFDPSDIDPNIPQIHDQAVDEMHAIADALFPLVAFAPPDRREIERLSWHLAGWIVLSDWLGSNRDFFPFTAFDGDIKNHLQRASQSARDAVRATGLTKAGIAKGSSLDAIIKGRFKPTASQRWAFETELAEGPALAIIEDVTGSGKTEAALILAHRMMQAGKADGIYIALPTMATANAMFERMADCYKALFQADATPSIALAHSARRLSERFRQIRDAGITRFSDKTHAADDDEPLDGNDSGAACSAWLADSSRKTFLAQMAVGTIDQALMAVLPAKFQGLRLHGLAQRVLIVDEAHAYDSYMMRELERLLAFQSHLGGSVIILSATLPQAVRQNFQCAFDNGLKGTRAETCLQNNYPLLTLMQRANVSQTTVEPREDLRRILHIERLPDANHAIGTIVQATAEGKAVAWVRNTVDDAIAAWGELQKAGINAELFHARFAMGHRLAIEQQCLDRFGKDGTLGMRYGRVLIATQVIEQSLDLDFDLMVSDLAPVDLLLQRAGRICRHPRGARDEPRLWVVSPDPCGNIDEDWYSQAFPGAAHVYSHHTILWRTAREIFGKTHWQIPEDVRGLIETVYQTDDRDRPPAFEKNWNEAEGQRSSETSIADFNLLKISSGYCSDGADWRSDIHIPTRLGEPAKTLRLAVLYGDAIKPLVDDVDIQRAWALSEVSVRQSWIKNGESIPHHLRKAAKIAKGCWTRFDEQKLLIVLRDGHHQAGTFVEDGLASRIHYSSKQGLTQS